MITSAGRRLLILVLSVTFCIHFKETCAQECVELQRTDDRMQIICTKGKNRDSECNIRCDLHHHLLNPDAHTRTCRCNDNTCRWVGEITTCVSDISATTSTSSATSTPSKLPSTQEFLPSTSSRGGTGRIRPEVSSTTSNCPTPNIGRHALKVLDTWPTGAMFRVVIHKRRIRVQEGWSALIRFTRNLPRNVTVMSWNSEVKSANGKYLGVSNMNHNADLTGYNQFIFTLVVLGTSLRQMAGYTALVVFFPERLSDASCFTLSNNGNRVSPPRPNPERRPYQTTTFQQVTQSTTRPTPSTTAVITTGATRPTTVTTTRRSRPTTTTTRSPGLKSTTTTTTKRQTTAGITRPTTITTTRRTTTSRTTRRPNPTVPSENVDNIRINENAVRRHSRGCNVLRNNLHIVNPGYEAPDDTGNFRFNANIMITGSENRLNDWTLKVVFSKEITSLQTWETQLQQKSQDGRVCIFRPHPWNSNLQEDFSFLVIPEMRTRSIPKVVMFLCPSEITPNMNWNGIFGSSSNQQDNNSNNNNNNDNHENNEDRERLEREQREREAKLKEEARQRRIQLERERLEREQNQNGNSNNNNNNHQNQNNNNSPNQNSNNQNQNNNSNQNNNNQNQNNNNNNQQSRNRTTSTGINNGFANTPRCRGPSGRSPSNYRQTRVSFRPSLANETRPYDYNEVLAMSILFYEAQRSGPLPTSNRIPWRGDSGLRDGCDVGLDLTGGWYDAGDHVKFGFPMAWSVTTLAWGVIEFRDAYVDAGEYENVLDSLKWVTDYFIKAHPSKYVLYGQVGNGQADHGYWGRAEEMRMARPSYRITRKNPGTELAAETAAAMAACSVIFRESNSSYADILVRHAKELYEFADKYRRNYQLSITAANAYYRSYSGYQDELVWGALWLYRATNNSSYLDDAINKYREFGGSATPLLFSWDDKRAGSQVLLANFTGEQSYKEHVSAYQQYLRSVRKTPGGLTWHDQWGSNRYAANGAFIALAAAKVPGIANRKEYIRYARSQIHFMLGSTGRSYLLGYGTNPPQKPHHRSSSCPAPPSACTWGNAFHNSAANPNILYGALIAGPNKDGSFTDDRLNYVSNEVATDYNAGFQGAVAGLKFFKIQARNNSTMNN